MRLKMKARQEVTAVTAGQYRGATKKEKRVMLDQFVSTTGYSRWYARLVLRHEVDRGSGDWLEFDHLPLVQRVVA